MSRPAEAAPGGGSGDVETLLRDGPLPAYRLTGWEEAHSGLRAGVTAGAEAGDLGIATERPPAEWAERMEALAAAAGARRAVLPRQVHGSRVLEAAGGTPSGVLLAGEADGLTTDEAGTLLAVTVADCVPVFVLDPASGALALLHAGWRGAAAGVLEEGLRTLEERYGSRPSGLRIHLGPAICGSCYEVGPEVAEALGRQADGKVRLDLRAILAERATAAGVPSRRVSRSGACTRCGTDHFFSYRGTGTTQRMAAFLGWQAREDGV